MHRTTYATKQLNLELVTSPPRKNFKHHFRVLIIEPKDEEENTCLEEMGGGDDEKFQATITRANFLKNPNVNLD